MQGVKRRETRLRAVTGVALLGLLILGLLLPALLRPLAVAFILLAWWELWEVSQERRKNPRLRYKLYRRVGLCYIGQLMLLPWIARRHGIGALLFLIAVVFGADIAAYFGGRKFGQRKLWPRVSPGKTWAGVVCGLTTAVLVAPIWAWLGFLPLGWQQGVLVALTCALVALAGDLLESQFKRDHGVKDSGGILPGHGGVLDRIDGLLPATGVYAALLVWML